MFIASIALIGLGVTQLKSLQFANNSFDYTVSLVQAQNAIERMWPNLCNLQHKPLAQLSGGEQQRAHIARALVQQPQLLIMDEPTSHLDIKYQIELMELVRSLKLTVLASFHDLNLACALCDRLLILKHGQLVADGAPKKVVTEQLLSDVFGVCAKVSDHPQQPDKWPLVQYFYGYQRHQHDG